MSIRPYVLSIALCLFLAVAPWFWSDLDHKTVGQWAVTCGGTFVFGLVAGWALRNAVSVHRANKAGLFDR